MTGSGRDHWQPDGELMAQRVTVVVEEGMRSGKGITRQPDRELMDIGVTAVVKQTMRSFILVQTARRELMAQGVTGAVEEAMRGATGFTDTHTGSSWAK